MASIVRQMNKPSNNYLAEMLIKALAMPPAAASTEGGTVPIGTPAATTRAGAAIARRHSQSLGGEVTLADGSGLSREDRAAPREVVDMLTTIVARDEFEEFETSLAIAGVDGTLGQAHARHPCAAQLQGQDRHAQQRLGAVGLLHHRRRQPRRLRDPAERGRAVHGARSAGSLGRDDCGFALAREVGLDLLDGDLRLALGEASGVAGHGA